MLTSIPGGRGRPRLPTRSKELRGTAAKGRNKNPNEPRPAVFEIPPAPEDLGEIERKSWDELRARVNELAGVVAASDMTAFRQMVHVHVICELAFKELLEAGVVITGDAMDRPHPAAGTHATHSKLLAMWMTQFGISGAAARSRVSAVAGGGNGGKNPEDEFG